MSGRSRFALEKGLEKEELIIKWRSLPRESKNLWNTLGKNGSVFENS